VRARLNFSGRRRTPLVLQTEAAECGLACLAMVAGYHGYRTDLATLRGRHSMSLKGTTLANLIKVAAELNLNSRPLRVELGVLDHLRLPAILHWDLNHFVVLVEVRRQTAVILDPSLGRRIVTVNELSTHFTGVALEITPSEQFRPLTERSEISLRKLVGRMSGLGRALTQLFVLGAILELFAIMGPMFMQLVLDHAVVSGDHDVLTVLALGFMLLTVIQVGVSTLRAWAGLHLDTTLNLHLLTRLFTHLVQLPMSYFSRRHVGDVVSRFDSLNTIRRTITTTFLEVLVDGLMAVATAAMMFLYSQKLALIVCGATALYAALRVVRYRPLREISEDQIICAAKQQTNFLETVRGMQSVKLFNRQAQRGLLYQNLAVDTFNAEIRVQKLRMLFTALNAILLGAQNVAVIWLGATLVLDQTFSVGMLFAFISYQSQFTSRMSSLIDSAISFKMLELYTGRVADIALTVPESELAGSDLGAAAKNWDIEVRHLSVRYADSEPFVLRDVNLTVEEGESVAVVGPSGCGKTTLLRAMLGLLPFSEGEISIGGIGLAQLGTANYRNLIGTVMQDDKLFSGSIADNITFFDPAPDMTRVERCGRLASIHDDILAMPMGYHTLIGDMGTVLSGGQKQRVLLARALYKEPKILLLDEATSHLDVVREKQVSDAIRQLNLTRVIVAHRPETIASADRVFYLDGLAPALKGAFDVRRLGRS
jgi:ATP-binding cassette, subfamily B, bacterial CvaB/MchF/RaxB